jgi:adenylate cyclase class IV
MFRYTYFAGRFVNYEDAVLRIKSFEGSHNLDYKSRDELTGVWTKFESAISDPDQTTLLLEQLGFAVKAVLHKNFRSWRNGVLALDLVEVNDLFTVLEAKFRNADIAEAEAFIRELGFNPDQADSRSSIDIYLELVARERSA